MIRKLMSAAALATVFAVSAQAQETASAPVKPISFGAFAGASLPTGDFGKAVKTGYTVGGLVGYKTAALPVGFRLDAAYSGFSGKSPVPNGRLITVNGDVVYDLPVQSSLRPYVLAGVGMVNAKSKGAGDSETAFGFNGGAGINLALSGFDTFLEARYNHASKNGGKTQFIPIVFGIKF